MAEKEKPASGRAERRGTAWIARSWEKRKPYMDFRLFPVMPNGR